MGYTGQEYRSRLLKREIDLYCCEMLVFVTYLTVESNVATISSMLIKSCYCAFRL